MTRASDAASADVQQFYERYPYPPPITSLEKYRQRWDDPQRRRAEHFLAWPGTPYRDTHAILIAGCGTSQAAKHALRWPNARVVGIDVSATSIRSTLALKRAHGLDNLEVRQLPLERAHELETTFDQIVCTGVLHHLPDPDVGLRALRGVLDVDGVIHLMVYAPYGRAGVYMVQELCRRLGVQATDDGIRDLVVALGALPAGHPLGTLLREAPDFREDGALADALLHPQDRAYSVPQLLDLLAREGLELGRWVRQAHYSARCGAITGTPWAPTLSTLPAGEQAAAVELFRGTMVRHSVIARRDDGRRAPRVDFGADGWASYVPIRLPETLCVDDRLPRGAAGVLLNRSHGYPDLLLPIDAQQKRMFDAIDGARTIGAIAGPHELEAARAFFEQLWWHDQVVFDATAPAPA